MYTIHCTLYIVQCTVYSVQCTLYSVQFLQSSHLSVVDIARCTMYTVQCILYAVHRALCGMCDAQCAWSGVYVCGAAMEWCGDGVVW